MSFPSHADLSSTRRFSVRRSLFFVVLACMLPALAVIAWLVSNTYQLKRETVERSATVIAQETLSRLESDFAIIESNLRLLATSADLDEGNLRSFQSKAENAVTASSVQNFVLTDVDGRQWINTLVPFGDPLPTSGTPPNLSEVFSHKNTVLTPLFTGPMTGQQTIAMGVPVWHEGEVIYSINIGMGPARINALLAAIDLPEGWLITVLDSKGVIVGRSQDAEAFVGQLAAPRLLEALRTEPSGSLHSASKLGIPMVTVYQTSDRWQWSVAVGVPEHELRDTLVHNTLWALGAIGLTLSIGVGLAWRLGQRVLRSIQQLNSQAVGVIEGKHVPPPVLHMEEAQGISQALQQASAAMGQALFQAHHDVLTGLGNRAYMETEGQRLMALSKRLGTPLGLLILDLDGFKAVNDTYGHGTGDQVLQEVARRIMAVIRREDIVVRLGGDEFCVMLYSTDTLELMDTASRLIQALSAPYPHVDCRVGASGGAVLIHCPPDEISEWIHHADMALYQAKAEGKGRVILAKNDKNTESQ